MASNPNGLDYKYFERKIAIMHRDGLSSWKPDELARELARMSRTADAAVMHEPEFARPAEQPQGDQVAFMPVERCYDVRAKMIIAFNEARKNGGDLDDGLDAAHKSALRYSPNPMTAEQPAPVAVALPEDWQDQLLDEMTTRFELNKHDHDHMVYDDTQIGVEFARDWIAKRLNTK